MHRRLTVLPTALAVLLLAPAAAHAKGLTGLAICGTNGCVDRSAVIQDDTRLMQDLLMYGTTVADPGPAPTFTLKESMGDGDETFSRTTVRYYPTLGIERFEDGTFHLATPKVRRVLATWTKGLRANGLPAPAAQRSSAAARPTGDDDGDGVPWGAWVGGGVALVALAALAAAAAVRRAGRPATG
jgi:hypothetical protein